MREQLKAISQVAFFAYSIPFSPVIDESFFLSFRSRHMKIELFSCSAKEKEIGGRG